MRSERPVWNSPKQTVANDLFGQIELYWTPRLTPLPEFGREFCCNRIGGFVRTAVIGADGSERLTRTQTGQNRKIMFPSILASRHDLFVHLNDTDI